MGVAWRRGDVLRVIMRMTQALFVLAFGAAYESIHGTHRHNTLPAVLMLRRHNTVGNWACVAGEG